MWDIRKTKDFGQPKAQWGREYYAKDGMGWYVPVLFVPYFEWESRGVVPKWDRSGPKLKRIGNRRITSAHVIWGGIRRIWADLPRIIRKEWYCDA